MSSRSGISASEHMHRLTASNSRRFNAFSLAGSSSTCEIPRPLAHMILSAWLIAVLRKAGWETLGKHWCLPVTGQPSLQEKFCDLAVDSPRFVQYVDILDAAATQCENERYKYPDNGKFIDYFERKCNLRDCRRQRAILGTWHYIPELPEFTVCEDCYDDVVRPLALAAQKTLARRFANPPRLLPGSGPSRCREASCQLYSPRMRAKFRDAVLDNDFRMLESCALKRFDAELRFRDREDQLLRVPEVERGWWWEDEWRRNLETWRFYE